MNRTLPFPGLADPIGLVRAMACQVTSMYAHRVHLDDLVGHGLLALVQCQARFDSQRGFRFTTFCWHRVRGAMTDFVRREARRNRFLRIEECLELPDEHDVEDLVVEHDMLGHVHREIEKMPVRRRTYMQSLLEGCTDIAACSRAAVSRGTAAGMRRTVIRELRSILEGEPEATLRAAA